MHTFAQEETLETWMKTIDKQPFATTLEPLQLMDVVTSLVSRAQLIEWGELLPCASQYLSFLELSYS